MGRWRGLRATCAREEFASYGRHPPPPPPHLPQSGIAGVDGNDPFDVPQASWERFRDTTFTPCYSRLTVHNDTHATVSQLWAANGTVGDAFTVVQARHGPFSG